MQEGRMALYAYCMNDPVVLKRKIETAPETTIKIQRAGAAMLPFQLGRREMQGTPYALAQSLPVCLGGNGTNVNGSDERSRGESK